MRIRERFSLYPRRRVDGKKVFYFRTYDEEGHRTTGRSTGQTSRSAARVFVFDQIKAGTLVVRPVLTFGKYAERWWKWGECSYIRRKLERGHSISHSYVDVMRTNLTLHVLPQFEDVKLSNMTARMIEAWHMELKEKKSKAGGTLSATTANACLTVLKIMLTEAARLGYIASNPAAGIEGLKEHSKERTILTREEVVSMFDEKKIAKVWDGEVRQYTINLLAASTGMRLGEVQALQIQQVYEDHVIVCHSWARKYGMKDPKWGSARDVPIPTKTARFIHEVIQLSPYREAEDLVFWGTDRKTPIQHRDIETGLYSAMSAIGINPEERRRRNVTFHSWRHLFNTMLRARGIADAKVRAVVGHTTVQMTEHYSHLAIGDFKDVLAAQESMFAGVEEEKGEKVG